MSISVLPLDIPDVLLISPKLHADARGSFVEIFNHKTFTDLNLKTEFVQDNLVYSQKNVLRGIHYQRSPMSQGKLLTVIKGKIFDVAVDIRPNSATFGKHVALSLNHEDGNLLFVPEGFAHGYSVISDYAIVSYKTTERYSPSNEGGIMWNDLTLDIRWPVTSPILSNKDKSWPSFDKVVQFQE